MYYHNTSKENSTVNLNSILFSHAQIQITILVFGIKRKKEKGDQAMWQTDTKRINFPVQMQYQWTTSGQPVALSSLPLLGGFLGYLAGHNGKQDARLGEPLV